MKSGKVLILDATETKKAVASYYAKQVLRMTQQELSESIERSSLINLTQRSDKEIADMFLGILNDNVDDVDLGKAWDVLVLQYRDYEAYDGNNTSQVFVPERMSAE